MKFIRDFFDSNHKHFSEGGRFARLEPLFEAFETLFFIPGLVTQKHPYVRDSLDLKRLMSTVIVALLPPLFFGIYNTGYQSNLATGPTHLARYNYAGASCAPRIPIWIGEL